MTLVAIHQPNFFPWLGYFDKIRRADVFIMLDDAQLPKKGGTWSNRVPISRGGVAEWLTAPLDRAYSGFRTIQQVRFAETAWRVDVMKRLELSYGGAPYASSAFDLIRPLMSNPDNGVGDFNCSAIEALLKHFGLDHKKVVRSSDLGVTSSGTTRLIDLTLCVGGTAYLSGGGAQGYQHPEEFGQSGVELVFQKFDHPTYPQGTGDRFLPGLSFFDALVNVGPDAFSHWLKAGGASL